MNDAIRTGTAMPLGPDFPWVTRYLGTWWIEWEEGWLRIIDDHVTTEFDDLASRLAKAAAAENKGQHPGPSMATALEKRWPHACMFCGR